MKKISIQNFMSLERLQFHHGSLCDTPLRTLEQAISAVCSKTWLGLALRLISKLTEIDFTHFGHLYYGWKNIQLTKDDKWELKLAHLPAK